MPTEKELIGIINGQRKYYREGVLRIAALLNEAQLWDYARAATSISENYGILNEKEFTENTKIIDLSEKDGVEKLILHELSSGKLSGSLLREKANKVNQHKYHAALKELIERGKVIREGHTSRIVYKLTGS